MMKIQQECSRRAITRLCHFTQSRNLAHILGDCTGILSRSALVSADLPHNPTDSDRYDGCDDLVCCSLEYPNTYYFAKVREQDHLFKDWVVLLINPNFIWTPGTKFCPCNAATASGTHIGEGYSSFTSLFASPSVGKYRIVRLNTHLQCSPTDIQAEILVPDPISLDAIIAIAVESEAQAEREICRLNLQGLSIDKPIKVVPDFYNKDKLAKAIQNGIRVPEEMYNYGGRHGQ